MTCSDEKDHFGKSLGSGFELEVNFYRCSVELENGGSGVLGNTVA